jgi:squalene-hopene/tetraprenyl-beta-curcumene cyclase
MNPVKPLRKKSLDKAAEWIIERQESDGSWGGIQPPWVYSLMALKSLGYSNDHPVIKKGLAGFDSFARETDETFSTDACVSPIWDTCLAMLALQDAGVPPTHPSLVRAAEWLLHEQVLHRKGDWAVKRPKLEPGGWAFEFENDVYPDVDDTAVVMSALQKMGWDDDPRMKLALERGLKWLFGMQSKNGGWASFDVDNTKGFVREIPFCDFGEVLDPPTEDVTAHALEILGRLGYRATTDRATKRGLDYLKATQKEDGSWWGRWGVNYIYGLAAVLPALKWLGEDLQQPYIRRAVHWLEARQNPDGGWGETIESYANPALAGRGPSTASQTGWALLALIAAGEARGAAARRGVEYLAKTQLPSGSWDEPYFTGTGFPMDFMINYHLYRDYWPLMALGQYRQEVYGQREYRDGRA